MDKYYTVQDVANYLKVHRTTVLRLIKEGRLEAQDVAAQGAKYNRWRIHDYALQRFMSQEKIRKD